jgi:hypothetical protein
MQKVNFNRGYIEVRAKFPSGVQVWPAIWLVSEDLIWGPEWDIWEYFGYRDSINGYDAMGMHLMAGYEQAGSMWPNQDPQFWDMAWIDSYDSKLQCRKIGTRTDGNGRKPTLDGG